MADSPRAVVLAAGRGTRMRSDLPKMLHPLGGRPLLAHVLDAVRAVTDGPPVVVVPPQPATLPAITGDAQLVEQAQPLGTGDALRSVPRELRDDAAVLVIGGDVPLLRAATLRRLLDAHAGDGRACTVLTTVPDDPRGLGRVVRDSQGRIQRIVEEADLRADQTPAAECNAGVYVFEGRSLWPALDRLGSDNAQGEVYLTDVVELLGPATGVPVEDADEAVGVNDRRQLAHAEGVLRRRVLDALMDAGVTVEDPSTTYVEATVRVGRDTVLRPMSVLRGTTTVGAGCEVGPMAQLHDSAVGDRVRIGAASIEESVLEDDVVVGQFARLRPGTRLLEGTYVGTHAELKNATVGPRATISHFSCVLDSDVGEGVNVGAGTVTCNYDGVGKHRTVVEDGVFLGSDSILVAPVRIGARAYVGAGSVITRDVPAGALAVERTAQRMIEGWSDRRRARALAAAEGTA